MKKECSRQSGAGWLLFMAMCCVAGTGVARADEAPDRARERVEESSPEAKAQSGAAAADEARIYTAQLKRCEGLSGTQREACVELARKRLGQL